jgi:hypothetical protein
VSITVAQARRRRRRGAFRACPTLRTLEQSDRFFHCDLPALTRRAAWAEQQELLRRLARLFFLEDPGRLLFINPQTGRWTYERDWIPDRLARLKRIIDSPRRSRP